MDTTDSSEAKTNSASINSSTTNDIAAPLQAQINEPALPKPKRPPHKSLWVILFVLLLIAAGALAFGILHKKSKPASQQASSSQKEIPLISVGYTTYGFDNSLYPAATTIDPDYDVNQQVFEGLVQFKNINQIKPNLAISWTNPDDMTWDFKLASNVKFHTGRTMTAADVKYSLESFNTTDYGKVYGDSIKSVEAIGDNEVKVITKSPDPLLLNKLAFLYIIDSKSTLKNDARNGTGPYTLKEGTTPSEKQLDLVAFDNWHGGRPLTRALTFKVYEDEDALMTGAKNGEINLVVDVFEKRNQNTMSQLSVFKDISFQHIGESVFRINSKDAKSPLSKLKVRQALSAAIDPTSILKSRGLEGVVVNQVVSKDVPGYNQDIPAHVRDAAKAKQLLKEAGYPNGLSLTFSNVNSTGSGVPQELTKEAAEAGITIKTQLYDNIEKYESDIAAGKLQFWGYSINTTLLDASDGYAKAYMDQDYSNSTVSDLLTQANSTLDQTKRLQILQELSKTLIDDVAFIPMYSRIQHFYATPSFQIARDRGGAAFGVNYATVYAK